MKIKKIWSSVVLVPIIFIVSACSGTPVEDKNVVPKTTVVAKKTVKTVIKKTPVKKAAAKKAIVKSAIAKKITPKKEVKKPITPAPKSIVVAIAKTKKIAPKTVKRVIKKPKRIVKARPRAPTAAESRAKKQAIAALARSKKEAARKRYIRTQALKKYNKEQKLKELALARRQAIARNRANNSREYASLGLSRFSGSQAETVAPKQRVAKKVTTHSRQPVKTRSQQPITTRARQPVKTRVQLATLTRASQPIKKQARRAVQTRAKQPVKTRSKVRIATRARQSVNTRARQPVSTRSKQVVRTRARQPIGTRTREVARLRNKQIAQNRRQQLAQKKAQRAAAAARARAEQEQVRARGIQFAAAQKRAREQANIRRVSIAKWEAKNRASTPVRKAVYKKQTKPSVTRIDDSFGHALSNAALERTKHRVRYDGKYLKIGYPWGDVPKSIGVCTDVVIRSYRRLGIDLQQEVHKDISQDFYAYPNLVKWGLNKPDPNIDHRRVYNLQAFFKRHKAELPRSRNPRDYKVGDLVTWMVGPNFPHIGVVVNKPSKADPNRLMIAHNIGYGPKVEDILFRFPMTGHYRYTHKNRKINPALHFAKTPVPESILRKRRNSGLTYAEMVQASKILTGEIQARGLPTLSNLQAKNIQNNKPKKPIMLAHLDAGVLRSTGINQDALTALLK